MSRAWGAGLVAAVLALLPVGCGADDAVRETVDPVAEAADRTTAAGGARLDGVIEYDVQGQRFDATLTGVVDFAQKRSQMRLDFPALGRRAARESGLPHDEIRDGLTVYYSTPQLRERLGAAWGKVDAGDLLDEASDQADVDVDTQMLAGWDESNPADLLRFLQSAGDAKEVGAGHVGGERVRRYAATVDLRRYAELVVPGDGERDAQFRDAVLNGLRRSLGGDRIPVEVALDGDGRVRRERLVLNLDIDGQPVEATLIMRFRDFGRHHEVELPAESDVEDITDRVAEFRTEIYG